MVALQANFRNTRSLGARRPEVRPRRIAVVLNANARRVDAETLRWVETVVPRGDLFFSRSLEEVPYIADEIVGQAFDGVLWGGGDGTFAAGVAAVEDIAARVGAPLPEMGVLRLGTGNAMADAIGAGPATAAGLADDLKRARGAAGRRKLALLDVEGRPAMFCGFGLDAQILEDFGRTVGFLDRVGLRKAVSSAGVRYALAVAGRSVPRYVFKARPEIVVINRGRPAVKVDVNGNAKGAPVPAGRVLYRGTASLASASMIPFYGLGLKMFPHVERHADRFQLRVAEMGAAEILFGLPRIWKGHFEHPDLHDYLVDSVEIVVARPAPFQANGDLLGDRERVTIGFHATRVPVV